MNVAFAVRSHPQKTAADRRMRARSGSGEPLSQLLPPPRMVRYHAVIVKMGESGGVTLEWPGIAAIPPRTSACWTP
jgi:hypothetical protein